MATRIRMPEPVRLRIRRGSPRVLGWLVTLLAIALVVGLAWYAYGAGAPGQSAAAGDRGAFIAQLEQQVQRLQDDLQRLQAQADTLSDQARQSLDDQREHLEELRAETQRLLEQAREHTGQAWEAAEPHLRQSWQQLQQGVQKLLGEGD
ncbi:MAG TPA: hypothetical protein VKB51_04640 [bacterium]|nr:hypothetical protein [bacterium]